MVEAAAFAVEKCLKQTKGQVCYICLDDESGSVRGCACRGDAAAHVSCLARQAHLHFRDNLPRAAINRERQRVCQVEQLPVVRPVVLRAGRHGDRVGVSASYSSRARHDGVLLSAMGLLARFLDLDKRHDEALAIREGAWGRPHWEDESSRIVVRGDLAQSYEEVDASRTRSRSARPLRPADAIAWARRRTDAHVSHESRGRSSGPGGYERPRESRDTLSIAARVLPREGGIFLSFRSTLAYGLYKNPGASLLDLLEAEARSTGVRRVAAPSARHPVVVKRPNRQKETREPPRRVKCRCARRRACFIGAFCVSFWSLDSRR